MPSRLTVLKPGQRERDGVGAGPQIDDAVLAGAVGDGRSDLLDQRVARRFDRDAWQNTAPDASLTTPVMEAWAKAAVGRNTANTSNLSVRMASPWERMSRISRG